MEVLKDEIVDRVAELLCSVPSPCPAFLSLSCSAGVYISDSSPSEEEDAEREESPAAAKGDTSRGYRSAESPAPSTPLRALQTFGSPFVLTLNGVCLPWQLSFDLLSAGF